MSFKRALQYIKDYFRPNKYELRPYLIDDDKDHPFAIICPGGAYGAVCSFIEGEPIAKELNKRGYNAFVLFYHVKKEARYPNPQEDLQRAIKEVFAHSREWHLITDNFSLWGSSAGGHLIASYCMEDWGTPLPNTLVLIYPVITLGKNTHKVSCKYHLGKKPDPAMVEKLSIEKHITSDFPPTYVWCGTKNKSVNPINSVLLETALKEKGVVHKFEQFEGIGHGVGLAQGTIAESWFDSAVTFWEEQTKEKE